MSKPLLNQVVRLEPSSVVRLENAFEMSASPSIIDIISLVNQWKLHYRTQHLNLLLPKQISAGITNRWWRSRTSEVCCACEVHC